MTVALARWYKLPVKLLMTMFSCGTGQKKYRISILKSRRHLHRWSYLYGINEYVKSICDVLVKLSLFVICFENSSQSFEYNSMSLNVRFVEQTNQNSNTAWVLRAALTNLTRIVRKKSVVHEMNQIRVETVIENTLFCVLSAL